MGLNMPDQQAVVVRDHPLGSGKMAFQGPANAVRFTSGVDAADQPGHVFFAGAPLVGFCADGTLVPPELKRLQDIRLDADGDPFGGFLDRVARKMRISRGRLHPAVTEEPADDWQALAERQRPGGKAVS